jgi:aromatic ring-opening dioxygenase catalytic subunit (LigB family)
MKFLIVLVILLIVLALIVFRYRKQIQTALYMWRMFKKMRQMSQKTPEKYIEPKNNNKDTPLLRCVSCGNWTPEKNVLKLGAKSVYCSANCMEKAVR